MTDRPAWFRFGTVLAVLGLGLVLAAGSPAAPAQPAGSAGGGQASPLQAADEALLRSAAQRDLASASRLLSAGASCDRQGVGGINALMAFVLGSVGPEEADPDREDPEQDGLDVVPWQGAAERAAIDAELLSTLLACTRQLDARSERGATAAHMAAHREQWLTLRRLVQAGADPSLALPDGTTVLMLSPASQYGWLVAAGADVRQLDAEGRTLLHRIARRHTGDRLLTALRRAVALGARDTRDRSGRYAADTLSIFEVRRAQALAILRAARD